MYISEINADSLNKVSKENGVLIQDKFDIILRKCLDYAKKGKTQLVYRIDENNKGLDKDVVEEIISKLQFKGFMIDVEKIGLPNPEFCTSWTLVINW